MSLSADFEKKTKPSSSLNAQPGLDEFEIQADDLNTCLKHSFESNVKATSALEENSFKTFWGSKKTDGRSRPTADPTKEATSSAGVFSTFFKKDKNRRQKAVGSRQKETKPVRKTNLPAIT